MKNTLLVSFMIVSMMCCTSGRKNKMDNFVYDYEKVLDKAQTKKLNDLYKNFEKKSSDDFVLVTTDNYGNEEGIASYARQFCDINGIGEPGKENWIVVVFSKKNSEIWMTTGDGIVKPGKEAITRMIVDSIMLPQFKEEKYFEGLWAGSNRIINFLETPEDEGSK